MNGKTFLRAWIIILVVFVGPPLLYLSSTMPDPVPLQNQKSFTIWFGVWFVTLAYIVLNWHQKSFLLDDDYFERVTKRQHQTFLRAVEVLRKIKERAHFIGMPQENMWQGKPDWRYEIKLIEEILACFPESPVHHKSAKKMLYRFLYGELGGRWEYVRKEYIDRCIAAMTRRFKATKPSRKEIRVVVESGVPSHQVDELVESINTATKSDNALIRKPTKKNLLRVQLKEDKPGRRRRITEY